LLHPVCRRPLHELFMGLNTKFVAGIAYLFTIFMQFGPPVHRQSDNGGEFCSKVIAELASAFNIQVKHGAAYNPREQRKVEKWNGILASTLIAKAMQEEGTGKYTLFFMIFSGAPLLSSLSLCIGFVCVGFVSMQVLLFENVSKTQPSFVCGVLCQSFGLLC